MKSFVTFVLLTTFVFCGNSLLSASPAPDFTAYRQANVHELVLLHSNDHHGTILPRDGRGGLAERAAYIRGVKAFNDNVLLLDAGDLNTGTALSNMFQAEADILAYNLMAYDAVTFGNHEFNEGMARLERQIAQAKFPFVSSNVRRADGSYLGGNQYLVKEFNGFKVGIFGITTLRAVEISAPDNSLTFINEIDAAREAVSILRMRENVDLVIGLVHMGTLKESPAHITSQELASMVAGIDIIVDGHSHTYMEEALKQGNTYIVSAHERGLVLGQGKVYIQNGKLLNFSWAPVSIGPDQEVAALLRPYIEEADASLKEVVGEASETFVFGNREPRFHETSIGNLINDANVWFFREVYKQQIDFAFHNGGNIRAGLPAGPITREDILTVLPFENNLFIVSMKGSNLNDLFNFMGSIAQGAGAFPQFSSDVRLSLDVPLGSIFNLSIGGSVIDNDRIYRFCTNDFLLGGGDGYTVLAERALEPYNTSLLLSYVVMEYINAQGGIISPLLDGRMNVIGGVMP